ncbi:hypothetical protein GCM10023196_085790 [Actinoallomurus vinaceus]|uniref:RNA polymerase sigma-70 region 2 domain-containing protein n=1 Tax=Actinoallomurus vinaceus TaxID=1080074 RepID=A0ABP8UPR8_9ACTN
MSLTEALRAGDPEVFALLYDEHGALMYACCRRMVGDEAADAVRDAFVAAARHPAGPPSDDASLPVWLYALARAECVRRGAPPHAAPEAAPLERALARLRPEHREALALTAVLETEDLARILGVARDTAELLVRLARRRLEQAVIAVLEAGAEADDEVLTALAKGRLHTLVIRPVDPPASLRERVLAACAATERATGGALLFDAEGLPVPLDVLFGPAEAATGPQPKVGPAAPPARHHRKPRARHAVLTETLTLAACAAAVIGAIVIWPAGTDRGASTVDDHTRIEHRATSTSSPASSTGGTTPLNGGSSPVGATPAPSAAGAASPSGTATPARPSSSASASRPPTSPSSPTTPTPKPPTSAPATPSPTTSLPSLPLPNVTASPTPAPKKSDSGQPKH